ncbi:MAG TPA: hypothetical protein VNN22_05905 [Verrucomicrobiae bacterium]|nr:hypothetical protein [Verrucomicrobiae bacterium]
MSDEFYIGWEAKAAPGISKAVRRIVTGLLMLALFIPAVLAISQRGIGVSVFEWGRIKRFSGVLKLQPYPHLLVPRPGNTDGQPAFSTYYLVAPFKHGLNGGKLSTLDGKNVSLQGTLIYRGNQTMVEALPDSIKAAGNQSSLLPGTETIALGRQTLTGEIVDSKCFLGVMNPGQLIPHRACAIRCISGGVPPVLLVRPKHGPVIYLLLVSADGKPVNQQVLDMVAEPLQITGEVEREGELLILRADPSTYRRVK